MMSVEIKKQTKIPLLNRERVTGSVFFEEVTPSRLDVKKEIAKKINAKEDSVVVRHIYGRYGMKKAKIIAHVYTDQQSMKKFESHNLLVKNGLEKPVEKTPASAEEKK